MIEQVHNFGTFFTEEYPPDLGTTNLWGSVQIKNSTKFPIMGWWEVKYVQMKHVVIVLCSTIAAR